MESSGSHRSRLLTAGGILSIIAGTYEVIGGGALVALVVSPAVQHALLYPPAVLSIYPLVWPVIPTWLIYVGVALLVLGAIAIVGGVSAARRKSFGLSLAGAICALPSVIFGLSLAGVIPGLSSVILDLRLVGTIFCALPAGLLGILAVTFVSLGRREFRAKA